MSGMVGHRIPQRVIAPTVRIVATLALAVYTVAGALNMEPATMVQCGSMEPQGPAPLEGSTVAWPIRARCARTVAPITASTTGHDAAITIVGELQGGLFNQVPRGRYPAALGVGSSTNCEHRPGPQIATAPVTLLALGRAGVQERSILR